MMSSRIHSYLITWPVRIHGVGGLNKAPLLLCSFHSLPHLANFDLTWGKAKTSVKAKQSTFGHTNIILKNIKTNIL